MLIIYCSVGLLIIYFIKLLIKDQSNIGRMGWWIDFLIFTGIAIYNLTYVQKLLAGRKNQFIEWKNNQLFYKLKDDKESTTVEESKIENVQIGIEIIELQVTNGKHLKLDISDFDNYEDRILIKSNMEKYKKNSA